MSLEADVVEGSDITANDMVDDQVAAEEPSEIVEFYKNSSILLTGGTGFLGKMIIEKLLRTCYDLNHIYLVLRPKKGKDITARFQEMFDVPCFEPLKRQKPDFLEKLTIVNGDLSLPNLGLGQEDMKMLQEKVNVVIHCAATVRFDEPLRTAANINLRSVKDLLEICKDMKNLKSMVYVSTAYANCIHKNIDEKFYDPPMDAEKLLTLLDCLDDDKLNEITPTLLSDHPNTYVFTKSIAESVIKQNAQNLPIVVFRPSIVIASVKEPVSGWIDNFYGATGVMIGSALGLLRTIQGIKENRADMVPADYVINSLLAAAWDIATVKTLNDNQEIQEAKSREAQFEEEIPVYNYVSSPERPITWDLFEKLTKKHATQVPSELCLWHYFLNMRTSELANRIEILFLHLLPAYIVDFFSMCIGKKPRLVKGYQKINKFSKVIAYFTMREWNFKNDNVQKLWRRMRNTDKQLFDFSMKNLNWDLYFYTYVRGARVYVLKDPLDTIPKGVIKYYKLAVAHYALVSVLSFCALYLLFKFINLVVGFVPI